MTKIEDITPPLTPLNLAGRSCFYFLLPGEGSLDTWITLRAAYVETGYWPLILGPPIGKDKNEPPTLEAQYVQPAEDILKKAEALGSDGFFQQYIREYGDPRQQEWEEDEEMMMYMGEPQPNHQFTVARDILSGDSLPQLVMALLPVEAPWQVQALVQNGGWNASPLPEAHVALMKRWHQDWGAEPVAITSDVIELKITRPPSRESDAFELAVAQYMYCPDIVDQGTMTLENLAKTIMDASVWYFWWD